MEDGHLWSRDCIMWDAKEYPPAPPMPESKRFLVSCAIWKGFLNGCTADAYVCHSCDVLLAKLPEKKRNRFGRRITE